jgi:hypothetical protein
MGLRITSELATYFVGLDLGQSRDHSALAVVERAEVFGDLDYVTYERRRALRYRVRFLERVRLGTPYPDVVGRVREVLRRPALAGRGDSNAGQRTDGFSRAHDSARRVEFWGVARRAP